MNIFLWVVYIISAIISFVPLVRLNLFSVNDKYRYFKYVSIVLFIWVILSGMRLTLSNPLFIYYSSLIIYPLIYLLTVLLFVSTMNLLKKKVHLAFIVAFYTFLVIEFIVALTNNSHLLMLEIAYTPNLIYQDVYNSSHGLFFYIHMFACYSLLLLTIVLIASYLYRDLKQQQDSFPFVLMVFGMAFGLIINFINLFFYSFFLDPTLVAFVILLTLLYAVSFIRDVRLIIKYKSNDFILNNLREMYFIVDQRNKVVETSKELINTIDLKEEDEVDFEDFMKKILKKAIVYRSSKELTGGYVNNKLYLHMMEKPIKLPLFKYSARFYLLYNETKIQKHIHDLDYVVNHDLMTGLYSRNYYEKTRLVIEKNYKNYTLAIFDLDGLKLRNDNLGHEAGDWMLIEFAKALGELFKLYKNLSAIRMGGDEFLLIAPDYSKNDIIAMIDKVKKRTMNKDILKDIRFSYGVATNQNGELSFSETLAKADNLQRIMKESRLLEKKDFEYFLRDKFRKKT